MAAMLRLGTAISRLRGGLNSAAATATVGTCTCGTASPAAVVDALRAASAAAPVQLRGFAVPSHMPDPNEPWPEGRRAPEGWWEDPAISTAAQAFEIFDASLEKHRHLRQRHIQEIIKRCRSAEDLQLAVDAMDKLMRFRRAQQVHKPFNTHTGRLLTEKAIEVAAPEIAAKAFARSAELGLTPGVLQVDMVGKQLGMKGDLDGLIRLLHAARNNGVRTTPNMAYAVALTARQTGQHERGRELIKEMELNGVRIRPIVWQHLSEEQPSNGASGGQSGDGAASAAGEVAAAGAPEGAGATSSAAAPEDTAEPSAEQKAEEGATPAATAGTPPGVAS